MNKETFSFLKITAISLVMLTLSSCALWRNTMGDKLVLEKSSFTKMSGWHADNHGEALASFLNSCKKMQKMPENKHVHKSGVGGKYKNWRELCDNAVSLDIADKTAVRGFFEANFTPYLATNWGKAEGRFTGYFEIALQGSYTKHDEYQFPIYKTPSDVKSGEKYYSREELENGAIAGRGLEIAWVNDPVRLFFLHIQGSGRIQMDDGSILRVGYAGKNNREYIAIGRVMIDKGYIAKADMSADAIKEWLYKNPDRMDMVMNTNPSYVFFREIGEEGPIGAQGVPLTPMRSLAVDKKFVPYGAPVWVDVELNKEKKQDKAFRRLLVAQDTGGAIKGPVRGDLFFGYGDDAEEMADYQNSKGRYYILLPVGTQS